VKVVIDTNVFVSGVFFKGPPYQILKAWRAESFELAISQEILDEYRRVEGELASEHSSVDLEPALTFITKNICLTIPKPLDEPVCSDPDDDKFLACALACESKIVVSGDKHLLSVSGYQEIEVMKPRQFAEKHLV
jgi:putative PIN family toxin of toxin-antitoxin system